MTETGTNLRIAQALESIATSLTSIAAALDTGERGFTFGESLNTVAMAMDGDSGETIGQSLERVRRILSEGE